MTEAHSGQFLQPSGVPGAWHPRIRYLQHLRVRQVLAVLSAQLLAQCLQLSAKQDDPFCGGLVAPTELPPWMPIVCTQRPAENTLEGGEGRTARTPLSYSF